MNVVTMRRWVNRDSVAMLRALLDLAERGELNGLALCYSLSDGGEFAELTGVYRREPRDGLSAAMRLSWHITQIEDEAKGSP